MLQLLIPYVTQPAYEENRIISQDLSETALGRDLLSQDYILKQLTASLVYPESELGNDFWKQVYSTIKKNFDSAEIPINTFNKIWIIPEKANVHINGNNVFVIDQHLKIMLEEDYLALQHAHGESLEPDPTENIATNLIRKMIIPKIEKDVNEGKNFAPLRQMFNAMILATWYKQSLKQGLLGKEYINKNKIDGIDLKDKKIKEKIYNQYVKAFKKGVYNYIKEDYDELTQTIIPRNYFSGGIAGDKLSTTFGVVGLSNKRTIRVHPMTVKLLISSGVNQQNLPGEGSLITSSPLDKLKAILLVAPLLITPSTNLYAQDTLPIDPSEIVSENTIQSDLFATEENILSRLEIVEPSGQLKYKIESHYKNAQNQIVPFLRKHNLKPRNPTITYVKDFSFFTFYTPAAYMKAHDYLIFSLKTYNSRIFRDIETKTWPTMTRDFLIHELIHSHSKTSLNSFLNEGITQYYTEKLSKIFNHRAYGDNVGVIARLLWWNQDPKKMEQALHSLYFEGNDAEIIRQIGRENWNKFLALSKSIPKDEGEFPKRYEERLRQLHSFLDGNQRASFVPPFLNKALSEFFFNEYFDKQIQKRPSSKELADIVYQWSWWTNNSEEVEPLLRRLYFDYDASKIIHLMGRKQWDELLKLSEEITDSMDRNSEKYTSKIRKIYRIFNSREYYLKQLREQKYATDQNSSSPITNQNQVLENTPGGIDLNSNNLELSIEGDSIQMNFQNTDSFNNISIDGLIPVIINIAPITTIPMTLGKAQNQNENQWTKPQDELWTQLTTGN